MTDALDACVQAVAAATVEAIASGRSQAAVDHQSGSVESEGESVSHEVRVFAFFAAGAIATLLCARPASAPRM